MGKLLYVTNVSLDGFMEDEHGSIDWSPPSDELFVFITELIRPATTYLYGRRMYESMAVWETDPDLPTRSALFASFSDVWRRADKIVYSTTLDATSTTKTRLERDFEPDAVEAVKAAATGDLTIGGAEIAAHAFNAGLVDECHLFVRPLLLGAGKPALPSGVRADLELLDERRFDDGGVYLRHRVRHA